MKDVSPPGMLDFAGSSIAGNNSTGQSSLGKIAQGLSGTVLFEVNFGSNGVSGKIGMGGIDVGGNMYRLGKGLTDKAILTKYMASNMGNNKGATAYNNYVYGDWTAENTSRRLGTGKDELIFADFAGAKDENGELLKTTGDAQAQTVSNGKGGRTITMQDMGNNYNNAVTLQHESYRDGVVNSGNSKETYRAVLAHTEMAMKMGDKLS